MFQNVCSDNIFNVTVHRFNVFTEVETYSVNFVTYVIPIKLEGFLITPIVSKGVSITK